MKYVLRNAPSVETPGVAVTRVFENGNGRDIAWFFDTKEALEYIDFLEMSLKQPGCSTAQLYVSHFSPSKPAPGISKCAVELEPPPGKCVSEQDRRPLDNQHTKSGLQQPLRPRPPQ